VHETREDLDTLQALLDASRATAGPHLREVFTDSLGLTAQQLVVRLAGVRILALATVTASGEPLAAPIDGIFYRGCFYFGSSPESVRLRHIATRPAVSATYLEGEELAVVVHGRAVPVDLADPAQQGLRACLVEVYGPRYGPEWIDWASSSAIFCRIEPRRLFASRLPGA
jgi:nitroimidazol reductase NimA-like FMN-containing flavoprotein (pyridoxamine 5'-phosphate oxidase superfamily)